MYSYPKLFVAVAFVLIIGYLVYSISLAVRTYREDKWARGNWALRLWWRWFSGTPAARKRRMETVAEIGAALVFIGIPVAWLFGGVYAWQIGKLQEYLDWTSKIFEALGKAAKAFGK